MLTTQQACELAHELPDVSMRDHFGSDAFRTPGGIFATVWHDKQTVNLMLTPEQQRRFVALDGNAFVAIDNAWGRNGATTANLRTVDLGQFVEALRTAWHNSAEKAARRASKRGGARRAPPGRAGSTRSTRKNVGRKR
ncbi:MAG TPA: hypothetical protein VFO94_07665 [Gammaproteobacteria bacterium]|nr:hypothetical protein [Gammaproteobacteria bacterium]